MASGATNDTQLAAPAAAAFEFLHLARELRNMIYLEMMKHPPSIGDPRVHWPNYGVECQMGLATSREAITALIPFLQSCSLINNELSSLIYSQNFRLIADPSHSRFPAAQWLSTIPAHRLVRLELYIDGRRPLTDADKAVRLLPVRAPGLRDLTIRMDFLDDHEDEWSWMDPMGEEVEEWAFGVEEPTKQADSEKRFFGGRLIAVLKRMRELNLRVLRMRPVEDERWVKAVCREVGIEVEVQSSYEMDGEPDKVLYKPGGLLEEVEGFNLEDVNLDEDVEYESGWEIN
ncbi:hypothetical protein C8A01DRAFT_38930 [Parachaetomium inaequale]|uniref:Uncharacterized protein n=1 Tax=Parachaetomium inaequale TaxID=2588326 RepID=A0AAN6PA99_9PEZI|nr:hypothetical protein C8A01DRAFT_38930 [Parachaetomium inaequale]